MPAALRSDPRQADQRLTEILESVRGVFAAKGFDGASMQDLAQAAGMSAGNFYRYFASKDAIIQAMVERDLASIEERFASILTSDDPRAMLMQALDDHMVNHDCDEGPIWAEITAAAGRRAEVGQLMSQVEGMVVGYLMQVLARIAGADPARDERFRPHAELLLTLVKGMMMRRRPGDGFEGSAVRRLSLRMIEALLADVADQDPAEAPQSNAR